MPGNGVFPTVQRRNCSKIALCNAAYGERDAVGDFGKAVRRREQGAPVIVRSVKAVPLLRSGSDRMARASLPVLRCLASYIAEVSIHQKIKKRRTGSRRMGEGTLPVR